MCLKRMAVFISFRALVSATFRPPAIAREWRKTPPRRMSQNQLRRHYPRDSEGAGIARAIPRLTAPVKTPRPRRRPEVDKTRDSLARKRAGNDDVMN